MQKAERHLALCIQHLALFSPPMDLSEKYELVVGLEVHAQLKTKSKLFCGDSTAYGAAPNTQISAITLAHPGSLPKLNKTAVEYAIKAGLATNCMIEQKNYFARKNYFYPDLPKGYQTSQHSTPICKQGHITVTTSQGEKKILINRIHMEEDAGKSIHDMDEVYSNIDLNRAGVPLIEIVTEPCINSSEEAFQYITYLRKLLRWIDVCDGNMEEGSLRCDANISVRLKGEKKLGTRVEVKNLNSIRNVKKAIEVESKRLMQLVEAGEMVHQQTRSFNADNDTTFALRDKEEANDYRYFPCPDLPPLDISTELLNAIQQNLPALPNALIELLQQEYQLSAYDAAQICEDKSIADYFLAVVNHTKDYKAVANWINGPLKQYANERAIEFAALNLAPSKLALLIELIATGQINFSTAAGKILPILIRDEAETPLAIATRLNLLQVSNDADLIAWADAAIAAMPEKVKEYKQGKKGLIGLFIGEVKKISKGKADPKKLTTILEEKLNS